MILRESWSQREVMRIISPLLQIALLLMLSLVVTRSSAGEPVVDWNELRDVHGQPVAVAGVKWKVVCFLGAECPLARLYGTRLAAKKTTPAV